MEIKKEKLEQIINQSANPSRLEPEQIPELELYIDQILMLFEDKLGENRRRENDKILTKSMVNNYSKEKMIRPMRGKKIQPRTDFADSDDLQSEKCALDWGHQTGNDPADGGGRAGQRNAGNL